MKSWSRTENAAQAHSIQASSAAPVPTAAATPSAMGSAMLAWAWGRAARSHALARLLRETDAGGLDMMGTHGLSRGQQTRPRRPESPPFGRTK